MSVGQGNIKFTNNSRPSGPPFVATSANNGVSVDPGTGRIVLGNATGGTQADLISNREIATNGFSVTFTNHTASTFTDVRILTTTDEFLRGVTTNRNAYIRFVVRNSLAGTAAAAGHIYNNDLSEFVASRVTSSAYTSFGQPPRVGTLECNAANGLMIGQSGGAGNVTFYTGGVVPLAANVKGVLLNGGNWVLENGTLTPADTGEKLQVTGALRIASATLIRTTVAFTNNAAAAVGTLNNAPAAGDPTKWIPINDNGTIRNIPAW